jgi:hypothetical protein
MTATDYHFLASILEVVGDKRGTRTPSQDASYNSAGFLAQALTYGSVNAGGADTRYVVETRIPWTDLGVTPAAGNFKRLDLAVGDRDGTPPTTDQYFDWANLGNNYNRPSGWKDVELVVDATAPAAPTNPTLSVVSSSQIDVSWTASTSSDVSRYRIFRGTTGTPALVAQVYDWPYQDTGLTAGTTYTYQIAAVDAGGNESPKTAPTSATTQSTQAGIPFGLFDLKPDTLPSGTIWTGAALADKNPSGVLAQLLAASNKSPRVGMWFTMAGGSHAGYTNSDGSFSVGKWKDSLDRGHGGDTLPDGTSGYYLQYLPYIQNGTFQGIMLLDDLAQFTPYPSFADIEAIAAHAKRRFPALPTAVRERATELEFRHDSVPYTKLDAAWAQFRTDRGPAASYRDANIAAAKRVKLGLILGINITDGNSGDNVPPDSLLAWGNELLKPGAAYSDYACGFYMWTALDYMYLTHPNMTTLANKAKSHVAAPCKRR